MNCAIIKFPSIDSVLEGIRLSNNSNLMNSSKSTQFYIRANLHPNSNYKELKLKDIVLSPDEVRDNTHYTDRTQRKSTDLAKGVNPFGPLRSVTPFEPPRGIPPKQEEQKYSSKTPGRMPSNKSKNISSYPPQKDRNLTPSNYRRQTEGRKGRKGNKRSRQYSGDATPIKHRKKYFKREDR